MKRHSTGFELKGEKFGEGENGRGRKRVSVRRPNLEETSCPKMLGRGSNFGKKERSPIKKGDSLIKGEKRTQTSVTMDLLSVGVCGKSSREVYHWSKNQESSSRSNEKIVPSSEEREKERVSYKLGEDVRR